MALTSVYESLCWLVTVLEGLFRECHSSSAHWADSIQKSPSNHLYRGPDGVFIPLRWMPTAPINSSCSGTAGVGLA